MKNCFEKQLPQPLLNYFKNTTELHNDLMCSTSKKFASVEEATANHMEYTQSDTKLLIYEKYKIT